MIKSIDDVNFINCYPYLPNGITFIRPFTYNYFKFIRNQVARILIFYKESSVYAIQDSIKQLLYNTSNDLIKYVEEHKDVDNFGIYRNTLQAIFDKYIKLYSFLTKLIEHNCNDTLSIKNKLLQNKYMR